MWPCREPLSWGRSARSASASRIHGKDSRCWAALEMRQMQKPPDTSEEKRKHQNCNLNFNSFSKLTEASSFSSKKKPVLSKKQWSETREITFAFEHFSLAALKFSSQQFSAQKPFFKTYILLIMLLLLSQFSPHCPRLPSAPHSLRPSPHLFSCPWAMRIILWLLHSLYWTSHPHGCSVATYLYFLIPSPLHPFSHTPLSSGNRQNVLHFHNSVFLFAWFCWQVCIYCHFIVHSFYFLFLNKSL